MRCDYPMGFDEDYVEPPEQFYQLILPNGSPDEIEEWIEDNENPVIHNFPGYESDDNISFPSIHTITDGSISSGSSVYGDEGQDLIVDALTSHFVENFSESSLSENEESCSHSTESVDLQQITNAAMLSAVHESSSSTINSQISDAISNVAFPVSPHCGTIFSNDLSSSNEASLYQEISVQTDVVSHNVMPTASTHVSLYVVVESADFSHDSDNSLSEVSTDTLLSDTVPINSSSPSSSHAGNNLLEHESLHDANRICDNSERTTSDSSATCSCQKHRLSDLEFISYIENSNSSVNILDFFDMTSHAECIHEDGNINSDIVSDQSVSDQESQLSDLECISDIENSDSSVNTLDYFDVTSDAECIAFDAPLSEEKDGNINSDIVSDQSVTDQESQLSDLECISDIENSDSSVSTLDFFDVMSDAECISFDAPSSDEMSIQKDGNINCDVVSDKFLSDKKLQTSDYDSVSDTEKSNSSVNGIDIFKVMDSISDSDSSVNTLDFVKQMQSPECIAIDASLSEEMSVLKDGSIKCDVVSDKSVPNLKRKADSSFDDNVVNKVLKYSISDESRESLNEVSSDNNRKEFSIATKRATTSEEDNSINTLPSTAITGTVILSPQKTSNKDNSVAKQQKD